MNTYLTSPQPGFYQYTYPTFIDTPQHISVHFLTPDGQQAFVSYPLYRGNKLARLIPVSWFQSVILSRLEGQPQLMDFLATLLTNWPDDRCFKPGSDRHLSNKQNEHGPQLVA
jgi:hypothetical protein